MKYDWVYSLNADKRVGVEIAIWEGINITSGRCHEGIGFISFLENGYRNKVTGTIFLSYRGIVQALESLG